MTTTYPKILYWDTETAPMIVASFGLYDQNHSYSQVYQDWFFICAQWQWEGERNVNVISVLDNPDFAQNPTNDRLIVEKLHALMSEANIVVAHNNDGFDWKKFMAKVIEYRLPPIDKPLFVDTLKAARRHGFTSNKLDDLNKKLGLKQKLQSDRGSWPKAAMGDVKAIESIIKYGKGDIPALRQLYLVLRPYMDNHPNLNLFSVVNCCPSCGSNKFQSRGVGVVRGSTYNRYQCTSPTCGKWFRGKRSVKIPEMRG